MKWLSYNETTTVQSLLNPSPANVAAPIEHRQYTWRWQRFLLKVRGFLFPYSGSHSLRIEGPFCWHRTKEIEVPQGSTHLHSAFCLHPDIIPFLPIPTLSIPQPCPSQSTSDICRSDNCAIYGSVSEIDVGDTSLWPFTSVELLIPVRDHQAQLSLDYKMNINNGCIPNP